MDNSWVKLYRKIGENPIMLDDKACRVFLWLLIHVDKRTGTLTAGRFMISQDLEINPSTVYKVLKRLEEKYKIVTLNSNNKFTTISLSNWAKYNPYTEKVTQEGNNKVTTKEQQSNNKVTHIQDNKTIRHKDNNILPAQNVQDSFKEQKKYQRLPTEKQSIYYRICYFLEDTLHTNIVNYPKQFKAIQNMVKAGYTEQQICNVIKHMATKNDFFTSKGFDLMTVANQIPLYKARFRKENIVKAN